MARTFPVVLRVQPVKSGQIRGAAVHQTRSSATPELNVDTSRTPLNRYLVGTGNVFADVHQVIAGAPRAHSDSTPCAEMVLSADDDYFDVISPGWREGKTSPAFEKWVTHNVEWLKKTYPGLATATLHLDEGTPHIHAMVVPIAEYEQGYRRGSKTVRKIHYNRIFGDDAQTIRLARDTNNSELTKLGRLQTEYAKVMAPCRLTRGIVNSRAHHRKVKQHGKLVNTPVITPVLPRVKVVEKTIMDAAKSSMGMSTEYDKNIADAIAERDKASKALRKALKHHEAKSKEFDTMKEQNNNMRSNLVEKDKTIAKLSVELALTKEDRDSLRQTPLHDVRIALCYDGPMEDKNGKPKWRNAIDMVKDVAGLDFNDAINWLYDQFGKDTVIRMAEVKVAQSVAQQVDRITSSHEARKSEPQYKLPYTKQEFAIRTELDKQLDAIGADAYRITLMHMGDKPSYNHGKGKASGGGERAYSRTEVLDLVPELNRKNWQQGYNIFITPNPAVYTGKVVDGTEKPEQVETGDKYYLLIDDLTNDSLSRLRADGYRPNLIQASSTSSIQAIIALPKEKIDYSVGNALFRQLNQEYGDKNISAFSHPFRAVGFRNVKDKHFDRNTGRFPVVKLLERLDGWCQRSLAACGAIAEATAALVMGRARPMDRTRLEARIFALEGHPGDDEADREAKRFYAWCEDRYGASVDWSRADWMLIQRLDKLGLSPELVGATVRRCSPGLAQRHPNLDDYVARSVTEARLSMK